MELDTDYANRELEWYLSESLNVSDKLSKDELVSLISDMRDNFKKMIDDEVDLNGLWNILIDSVTVLEH